MKTRYGLDFSSHCQRQGKCHTYIAEFDFSSLDFYGWLPSKNKLLVGLCLNARPCETSSVTFRLCFDRLLFH